MNVRKIPNHNLKNQSKKHQQNQFPTIAVILKKTFIVMCIWDQINDLLLLLLLLTPANFIVAKTDINFKLIPHFKKSKNDLVVCPVKRRNFC